MKNKEYEEEKKKKKKNFSYGKPCIPLSATETSCSLVVNRGNDGVKFQSPGCSLAKISTAKSRLILRSDMQQHETGQPLLPHCCSHVVVEPTQCACTSLTLTRGHRKCASQLQVCLPLKRTALVNDLTLSSPRRQKSTDSRRRP